MFDDGDGFGNLDEDLEAEEEAARDLARLFGIDEPDEELSSPDPASPGVSTSSATPPSSPAAAVAPSGLTGGEQHATSSSDPPSSRTAAGAVRFRGAAHQAT